MDTSSILLATGLVSSLVANAGQLLVLKRQKAEAENKLSIAELMRAAAFASRDHWQVQLAGESLIRLAGQISDEAAGLASEAIDRARGGAAK